MPAIVWYIIVLVLSVIISYLLAPSMSQQQGQTAGELQAATVDSSSPVPVLFGTRRIDASNCVWYGDVSATPITKCEGGKK